MKRFVALFVVLTATLALAACGGEKESAESTPAAGNVPFDRAFIDGMVPHHIEAIAMAQEAKTAGVSVAELVDIADAIIETQQTEIDSMLAWRGEWYGSSEVDPEGAGALGLSDAEMGMQHDAGAMAGAEDVDSAFATMMIDHHRGAVMMAKLAQKRGEHAEIRELAGEIIEAQEREIATLQMHAGKAHH